MIKVYSVNKQWTYELQFRGFTSQLLPIIKLQLEIIEFDIRFRRVSGFILAHRQDVAHQDPKNASPERQSKVEITYVRLAP